MECYYSKSKIFRNLMTTAVLLTFVLYKQINNSSFLLIIPVFLILAIWGTTKMLSRKNPVLVIDYQGISDNTNGGFGLIPWDEITSIQVLKSQVGGILNIDVTDREKYLNKAPNFKRMFISPLQAPINIFFFQIAPGIKEVWQYLKVNYPAKLIESSYDHPKSYKTVSWKFIVGFTIALIAGSILIVYFQRH